MTSTYATPRRARRLIPILHPIGDKGDRRGAVLSMASLPEIGSVKVPITSKPLRHNVTIKVSQRPLVDLQPAQDGGIRKRTHARIFYIGQGSFPKALPPWL